MHRSAALVQLSRDHHHALQVALRLRRADAASIDDAVAELAAFWEPRGRRHFELEEALLLPALPADDAVWARATARVRAEHAGIRGRLAALGNVEGAARVVAANDLGDALHDHVRFEERELYGLLEAGLSEEQLGELGSALATAEH